MEKLCQRFKLSTEERQWRDLAYCLSLFSYNERSLRKLIENLDCYKDKLHCAGVMDCFTAIINNTNKMARNEIKVGFLQAICNKPSPCQPSHLVFRRDAV